MNHSLKAYQREALVTLRDFWTRCADLAGAEVPRQISQAFTNSSFVRDVFSTSSYLSPTGLDTVPTVCVRIPTGGGKTFLAANACGVAKVAHLRREHPVVVWLAPSTAIVEQTVTSLQQKSHPCHRALVDGSDVAPGLGPVRIVTVAEAMRLGPAAYAAASVVIVATVQQFRQERTDGRRVYDDNPNLREHEGLGSEASLVKVLAGLRPFVVVDEAHNVNTRLSFETLARLNPALILEITATPSRTSDNPSNVLYSASPLALFQENMIRLPIEVAAHDSVDACLEWSLRTRERLAGLAEREHATGATRMRPILLIQADATREGKVTDDEAVIERKLIEEFQIPKEHIAVHTGKRKDLEGVDLLSNECPYTIIITKEALKEGWDCPWAYVLCTLRPSLTDKDAVQLVGRILRQYHALRRSSDDLNKAFVAARNREISVALGELKNSLVKELGYDEALAAMQVLGAQQVAPFALSEPVVIRGVQINAERVAALSSQVKDKVVIDAAAGTVTISTVTSLDEDRAIAAVFNRPMDAASYSAAARRARSFASSPTDTNPGVESSGTAAKSPLHVKRLMVPSESADIFDVVADHHFDPEAYHPSADSARIDFTPSPAVMGRGRIRVQTGTENYRATASFEVDSLGDDLADMGGGDPTVKLTHFLSMRIPQTEFLSTDRSRWIADLLGHLTRVRSLDVAHLWEDRYRLLSEAQKTIDADIEAASQRAIQQTLFQAPVVQPSDDLHDFIFQPGIYPAGSFDTGADEWKTHYYSRPATLDSPNERACAHEIDRHPNVTCWVRNLVRSGFRLPRIPRNGHRWFYPDFVVWLKDGRVALVEHKGRVEQALDVADKKNAGNFWAQKTGGVFVMTEDDHKGNVDFAELRRLLS